LKESILRILVAGFSPPRGFPRINFVFYCICDCLSFSDSITVAIGLNNCNCVTRIFKRFHDEEDDDLYNKFVHLKENGSVNDYTHEWEVLATRQCGFTYEQLLKMYICGLKDYICSEIKLWNPKTIEDARHATRLIEYKDKFNKPSFTNPDS
jgi:predicted Zn-ribbon and HTH transcriptional regulator